MSELMTNIICSLLLSISGLISVKNISGSLEKLVSIKSIILMLFLIIIPAFFHNSEYTYLFSITMYIITIITYKEILNISIINSVISCGIMHLAMILLDFVAGTVLAIFISIDQARQFWYLNIISNTIFSISLIILFGSSKFKEKLPKLVEKIENKKVIKIVLAIIIVIIASSTILYTMGRNFSINSVFTTNFLLFLVFFFLIVFLLGERSNFEKLSDEYEGLFKYIQIFEDWIEKEQLTRHEYKNQLAVLRSLTKEKKVKDKIDSIVEDFINIDNHMISQLKSIPNGGLKGLLYYKIAIATKDKVEITIDVDEKTGELLSKIRDERLKDLSKLLGIYLDNAIEAAKETRKKLVTIEIYEIKDNIKIVISNSFRNDINISNRYQKGISTKGDGRGNGLYFANKLISKNIWIKEEQEIVNNFYIQQLLINIKNPKEKV